MTRPIHNRTAPSRETSKAWAAFWAYRDLPPGERSLEKLCERFRDQAQRHTTTPECPPPPTTNPDCLRRWYAQWGWQARLAVLDAEAEAACRQAMAEQVAAQAREDATLLHGVGTGALAAAAIALRGLVDSTTGPPRQPLGARDVQALARASIDCLMASRGEGPEAGDPSAAVEKALRHAPDEVRRTVTLGLRSLHEGLADAESRR
jgi:hypothetical protein